MSKDAKSKAADRLKARSGGMSTAQGISIAMGRSGGIVDEAAKKKNKKLPAERGHGESLAMDSARRVADQGRAKPKAKPKAKPAPAAVAKATTAKPKYGTGKFNHKAAEKRHIAQIQAQQAARKQAVAAAPKATAPAAATPKKKGLLGRIGGAVKRGASAVASNIDTVERRKKKAMMAKR